MKNTLKQKVKKKFKGQHNNLIALDHKHKTQPLDKKRSKY